MRARSWLGLACALLAGPSLWGCTRESKLPRAEPSDASQVVRGPAVPGHQGAPAPGAREGGPDASLPILEAPKSVPLVRARRSLMSTLYEITLVAEDSPQAHAAMERALDEVARLERELSEWIPESEVSRVNAQAGKAPVKVGPDLQANIRASLDAAERTQGAFDPTWAVLRPFYLFQPGQRKTPDLKAVKKVLGLVNYRDLVLDEAQGTVFLKRPGMSIGLGGIAKGWAVDKASQVLVEAGFPNHMVFAGGQVLVRGARGDRSWRVGIQHPRMQGYIGFVEVSDASVATAGDYEHSFIGDDGRHWHHILDLKTGLPATRSTSVTLVAPTGLLADALDTGCFVMGPERCIAMLEAYPEPLDAVIIDENLRVFTTKGMAGKLVMRMPVDAEGRLPRP